MVVVAAHQRVVALHLIVPGHREVSRHVHPDCVLVRLLPNLSKRFQLVLYLLEHYLFYLLPLLAVTAALEFLSKELKVGDIRKHRLGLDLHPLLAVHAKAVDLVDHLLGNEVKVCESIVVPPRWSWG